MNSDRLYSALVPMIRSQVKGRMIANRRRHYEAIPIAPKRVLFLGDSLTEGGLWGDLFPDLPVSNRSIGGEATYDLAERLDGVINDPIAVSLMIGTNDLHGPRDLRDTAGIAARTEDIIRRIRASAPAARLLVNSVAPRTTHFVAQLRELNESNRAAAERHGAVYVDLWPEFADDAGVIHPEYARDNLHLTPAGYKAWAEVLRPFLATTRQ